MTHTCEWCFNKFKPIRQSYGFYCSLDCSHKKQFMDRFLNWYYDKDTNANNTTTKSIKIFLLIINGNICSNHQKTPSDCVSNISLMSEMPLVLDHIDGDFKNNNYSNLRLLCPNCHSLTSTYKSFNTLGRHSRSKK